MATKTPPRMIIQARPEASAIIRKLARSRDLKVTAVIDVLIRAWGTLSPEEQERAFVAPEKGGGR